MSASYPETMGIGEFARLLNRRQSYISQLKKEGRLVLSGDGRRVRVAESIARIQATSDPSRQGVAQRHARQRAERAALAQPGAPQAAAAQALAVVDADHEDGDDSDPELQDNADYQSARAMRERWNARRARREYLEAARELIPVSEHNAAFGRIGAATRHALEALCSTLPPQLMGCADEHAIRTRLREEIDATLAGLSALASELARQIKQGGGIDE